MQDIQLNLNQSEFKQLCEILATGMARNLKIPTSADPPTWQVFSDGTVSVTLNNVTLANVTFALAGY